MTLTLNDHEVSKYFDMYDRIRELEDEVQDLKDQLYTLTPEDDGEYMPEVGPYIGPSVYAYTAEEQNRTWSEQDIRLLKDRIFYQGKYSKDELNIYHVHKNVFPHRTLAGLKAKIYDLGGRVLKDHITYVPKKKS